MVAISIHTKLPSQAFRTIASLDSEGLLAIIVSSFELRLIIPDLLPFAATVRKQSLSSLISGAASLLSFFYFECFNLLPIEAFVCTQIFKLLTKCFSSCEARPL